MINKPKEIENPLGLFITKQIMIQIYLPNIISFSSFVKEL